jgi:hypothetical protein
MRTSIGLNFIYTRQDYRPAFSGGAERARGSRLTSPFVVATRRIRAFSARVPKPNNAADESKEKLKGKAGGMHEGCRGWIRREGVRENAIRQIASIPNTL